MFQVKQKRPILSFAVVEFNAFCFLELLKVKAKARSKGELRELASCCNVLGELYQQQGKYEDAIAEHEVQIRICLTDKN